MPRRCPSDVDRFASPALARLDVLVAALADKRLELEAGAPAERTISARHREHDHVVQRGVAAATEAT